MKFVSALFLFIAHTLPLHAAIHGENNIWAAPDKLNCLPWHMDNNTGHCTQTIDVQLKNLIQRTGMTQAGGSQGTAFLVGKDCQWIISTAHTINHLNGKQRAPNKTVFHRNVYENNQKIDANNRPAIHLINDDRAPITDLNDRQLTKLAHSAKDDILSDCSTTPTLTEKQLHNNLHHIDRCLIMSFNQDLGNRNASQRNSMTFRTHQGLKQVKAQTRGITSCRIQGFAYDGMIETDCDSVYASSGSPFFCQMAGGEWKLTGTLVADTCHGYDNYDHCLNPAKNGQGDHETLMLPINQAFHSQLTSLKKSPPSSPKPD